MYIAHLSAPHLYIGMHTYCNNSISFAHNNKYAYNHTSMSSSLMQDMLHGVRSKKPHKDGLKQDILDSK